MGMSHARGKPDTAPTTTITTDEKSRMGRVDRALHEARSLIGIKRMIPSRQLTLWYFALAGALRSVGERGAFDFANVRRWAGGAGKCELSDRSKIALTHTRTV